MNNGLKGFIKKTLLTLVIFMYIFSAACKDNSSLPDSDVEIWGASSHEKILQDGNYNKMPAEINVSAAKGETEGGQIIITPHCNVEKVEVTLNNLTTKDGDVFDKRSINVYYQKYIEVSQKTYNQQNYYYPVGFYPDMLLPIDIANKFGETKIIKDKNQGLTIEFDVPADTKEGEYFGNVTVNIDGNKKNIPIKLNVWNYVLDYANGQTCFNVFKRTMIYGELDNTYQKYKEYYDTVLNKYKTCLQFLPNETEDVEGLIKSVKEYWNNPYFTTYDIVTHGKYNNHSFVSGEFKRYLKGLALASTPQLLLLEKAIVYLTTVDEPSSIAAVNAAKKIKETIYAIQDEVISELISENFYDNFGGDSGDFALKMRDVIKAVPLLVTSDDIENSQDAVDTFCSPIQFYQTDYSRYLYSCHSEQVGKKQWIYTCLQPLYPYPTHHMDDFLAGGRILRWMQKAYNIQGYLYWAISEYYNQGSMAMLNPYTESVRYTMGQQAFPGDGYMLYPGVKYGSSTPLGSLRLLTVRDGQEDYDALCLLEDNLSAMENNYGLNKGYFSTNNAVQGLYNNLFTNIIYNPDFNIIDAARNNLAKLIEMSLKGIALTNYSITDNVAEIAIFTPQNYIVKAGNIVLSGTASENGVKYIYRKNLDVNNNNVNFEIIADDGTEYCYNYALNNEVKTAIDFSEEHNELIALSEKSEMIISDNKATVNIKSKGNNLIETMSFKPQISFNSSAFGDFNKIDKIFIDLKNIGITDAKISIALRYNTSFIYETEKILLSAGKSKSVILNRVYATNIKNISNVNALLLIFDNSDGQNNLLPDRQIELLNVSYSLKDV